jgi:5-(carboxyamino)imidazole ribonucleotide synthase
MLGGGQLGRYAVMAARQMGYSTVVLDPSPDAPAGTVADEHLVADFDDASALDRLSALCAVVTTEFENPPAASLDRLARSTTVRPVPSAIAIAQDRIAEKEFLVSEGIAVGAYRVVGQGQRYDEVVPGIMKTARLGYDGHGQRSVISAADVDEAVHRLGDVPCVIERRLDLVMEMSVVLARAVDGSFALWEIAENVHVAGVLDLTVVPARISGELAQSAIALARHIADALDYVGVLAVEMFVVDIDGELRVLVNELAPRPHNSGHWTLDGSMTDQFAQQIRAVTGVALGSTQMTSPAVAMVNLLGDLWRDGEPQWASVLVEPDAHLHLYGKSAPRSGRKMGHLTVTGATVDEVAGRALALRSSLSST